jgi:hypothetical protein
MGERYRTEAVALGLRPDDTALIAVDGVENFDVTGATLAQRLHHRLVKSRKSHLRSQMRWMADKYQSEEKSKLVQLSELTVGRQFTERDGLDMLLMPEGKDAPDYRDAQTTSGTHAALVSSIQSNRNVIVTPSANPKRAADNMPIAITSAFSKEARAKLRKAEIFEGDLSSVLAMPPATTQVVRAR